MSARRQTSGPGPGGRGIVLLAVAVVLGVVLLQDLGSPPQGAISAPSTTTTTEVSGGQVPVATEPTVPVTRPPGQVKVLVVNAAATNGLARIKSKEVAEAGYGVVTPVTALGNVKLSATTIQYVDDYIDDARGVARVLGLSPDIVTALASPPVQSLAGANVIVVLGADADPPGGVLPTTTTTTLG